MTVLALCGCGRGNPALPGPALVNPRSLIMVEEIVSKTFSVGEEPALTVEFFQGPIEVVARQDQTIELTLTKRAGGNTKDEAEAAIKEISVTIDENDDSVRIVAEPPKGKGFIGSTSARLGLPVGTRLDLKTNLDRITVMGVHGPVTANNSQGSIVINDARGPLTLKTSLAAIEVQGHSEAVKATNSQGSIVVRDATGVVDLSTTLSRVELDGPATQTTIKNSQGSILVRRAVGTLDLTTNLAGIDVDAPSRGVTIRNSQGAITVVGANGPINLATNLASIMVTNIDGEVEAVNSQGGITIKEATGSIIARTSLAAINLESREAIVDATNSQGTITFKGHLAAGKHSFRTRLGNVNLTLPAVGSFHIDAMVSLGTISNSFPISQTEKSSPTNLVGTVGNQPKATIQVNVQQGIVRIERGK